MNSNDGAKLLPLLSNNGGFGTFLSILMLVYQSQIFLFALQFVELYGNTSGIKNLWYITPLKITNKITDSRLKIADYTDMQPCQPGLVWSAR